MASVIGVGVVALTAGCGGGQGGGHSTTSTSSTVVPAAAPTIAPKDINALIVPPDAAGELLGTKFNWVGSPPPGWTSPPSPFVIDEGNPECDAAMGLDSNTVGVVYTAWRSNHYKEDKDTFDHAVYQVVATVADPKAAKQLLADALGKPLNDCNNVVIHRKDDKYHWRIQKSSSTDTEVLWTATELLDGQVVGWVCANEARAKNNVVISAQVCQNGNGAPVAKNMADMISAKIPG
ncbi:sensor domain-containing protein [Mycobacterium sp. 050272]|uniref:sensor domain-containing protein n=1 Tax=Mycobacterium sp. 050272 TaxID=3142488 RepID=UPI003185AB8C